MKNAFLLSWSKMDLYRAHVTPVQFMAKNMSRFILKKQETDLDLWPVRKYCKIEETLTRGTLCIKGTLMQI